MSVTAAPKPPAPNAERNAVASCVSGAHVFATCEFKFTNAAHEIQPKCIDRGTCVVQYHALLAALAAARSARCAEPSATASATNNALDTQKCLGALAHGLNAAHHNA